MNKVVKYSRQREALLELLRSVRNHPTADWLYTELKKDFPNISLATVYRNLLFLTENGDIQKLDCGTEAEHYDGNAKNHPHFVCRKCKAVKDVDISDDKWLNNAVISEEKLFVESYSLVFYGLCEKCM